MDALDTLKTKYAAALKTITETGTHLTNLHAEGGKLVIKGAAPSEQAKNEVWTAIKAVDASYPDVTVDLAVDSSLPVPPRVQSYTVVAGDTLSKISKHFYGNANAYMKIFEANTDQLKDPNMIKVGQVLKIPRGLSQEAVMDLLQAILNAQGGGAVSELAGRFGLDQGQAASAVEQLLPALAEGLKKNAATPQGLEALMGALQGGGHAQYLDDPSRLGSAEAIADGNGILGHILGSKDVSRQVAAQAASQTGIGADVLRKMLPMIATLAMGAMAKQSLGSQLNPGAGATGAGGLMGMLAPMLDKNRDGSVADDVMGMFGKFLK